MDNASSSGGAPRTIEPARAVPLAERQERAILRDVQALPTNGRKKLEIWREGSGVRVAEVTRPEARKY